MSVVGKGRRCGGAGACRSGLLSKVEFPGVCSARGESCGSPASRAGGQSECQIAVDSGGPITKDVTYRIAATGNLSDGWVDHDKTSNLAVSTTVRVQQSESFSWKLSTDYSDRRPDRYFGTLISGRLDTSLRFTNFNVSDSNIRY
jgi:hypothetical protein